MNNLISPCKGCCERDVGASGNCHTRCQRYLDWSVQYDKAREEKKINGKLTEMQFRQVEYWRHKRQRKSKRRYFTKDFG